jgi:hypothetical protein
MPGNVVLPLFVAGLAERPMKTPTVERVYPYIADLHYIVRQEKSNCFSIRSAGAPVAFFGHDHPLA